MIKSPLHHYGFQAPLRLASLLSAATLGVFAAHAGTSQTITFPEIFACATNSAPFTLSATASSGLAVTYTVLSSGNIVNVTGNLVTPGGTAGSVTIEADQAGNGTYNPAAPVIRSFVVSSAPGFVQLAQGSQSFYSMAIRSDGTLWTWGGGGTQLGLGVISQTNLPTQVGLATNWQMASAGSAHTEALKTDGTLWAWGNNGSGQFGTGTTISTNFPGQVGTNTWTSVAAGNSFTMGIRSDGTLWGWGQNGNGQLGIGNTSQSNSPAQVGAEGSWRSLAVGSSYTMAIKTNGTLWGWGINSSGQLGFGNSSQGTSPAQVGVATNWLTVAVGTAHTLAIKTDGTLWAWGFNVNGQLGIGNTANISTPTQVGSATNWLMVSGGNVNSLGLKTDGTLWTWGNNVNGLLGNGNYGQTNVPAQVGTGTNWLDIASGSVHCLAVRTDGTVWAWGASDNGQLASVALPVPEDGILSNQTVRALSVGDNHSVVIKNDGTIWGWGDNNNSQLGDGSTLVRVLPVEAGTATNWQSISAGVGYTMAIKTDGTLWGWGSGANGQLGNGGVNAISVPSVASFATNWQTVCAGNGFAMAIKTDGSLWAWGANGNGQLGLGVTFANTNVPVQVGTATNWIAVATGNSHTLALKNDGTLWAWGNGGNGELGNGFTFSTNLPIQVPSSGGWAAISAGNNSSYAIRTDGTLWAWGNNANGELGIGNNSQQTSPMPVNSPGVWQSVAAGNFFAIGTKTDGTLWTWGNDPAGQLGDGNNADRYLPEQIGGGNGWSGLDTFNTARHSLVLHNGHLWAIGSNLFGQAPGSDAGRPVLGLSVPVRAAQSVNLAPFTASLNVPVTLSATAPSGLPVSLSVNGPATLSNNVLTVTGGGAVTVSAWQTGDESAWLPSVISNVTYVVPLPELSVSDSTGAPVANGATANLGIALLGATSVSRTFTITNNGGAILTGLSITKDGANPGDFLMGPPGTTLLVQGQTTTFTVIFNPANSGVRTAALHIASNAPGANNPYNIALTGRSLSFSQDSTGDGMSDAAKYELSAFGFNWQVSQPALVNAYYSAAGYAGLYTPSQVQTLRLSKPVIQGDPASAAVTLQEGLDKSLDQVNFIPFPLTPGPASLDARGNLLYQFTPPGNAVFYRLQGH